MVARVSPDWLLIMASLAGPRSNWELEFTGSGSEPRGGKLDAGHIGSIAQPREQGQDLSSKASLGQRRIWQESAQSSHSSLSRLHSCTVKTGPEPKQPGPLERQEAVRALTATSFL